MEIVVLNYRAGTVNVFSVPNNWGTENIEEFLDEIGLPVEDSYHMVLQGESFRENMKIVSLITEIKIIKP